MNRNQVTQLQPEDFALALKELGSCVDELIDDLVRVFFDHFTSNRQQHDEG